MSELLLEWLDGKPGGEQDEEGWLSIERVALVTGVPGQGYSLLHTALLARGLPTFGDEHPRIANMILTRRLPRIKDIHSVEVRLVYTRKDEVDNANEIRWAVSTSAVEIETNKDINGDLITVEFGDLEQSGTIKVQAALTVFQLSRREKGSAALSRSQDFPGTYDSGRYKIGAITFGYSGVSGLTRCSRYDLASTDGGKIWDAVIEIEVAPLLPDGTQTWAQEVFYIDPTTGRLPDGVIKGDDAVQEAAIKSIAMGPRLDYNELNLTTIPAPPT